MSSDLDFRMTVEDVFFIRGRGTVVTGIISRGTLSVGDLLTVTGGGFERLVKVIGIEIFHRKTKTAGAGERVGIFLQGIAKDEINRDDVLAGANADDFHL